MGHYQPRGTYLENSAIDAFLLAPATFGDGPFVISEFCLAEKTRLPWDEYRTFVLGMSSAGVRLLAVPPVTQIVDGTLGEHWLGQPFGLVKLNIDAALRYRRVAQERLDALCAILAAQFRQRYAQWRPEHKAWLDACDARGGAPNPRSLDYRSNSILQATLGKLGLSMPPTPDAPLRQRLHWNISTWEAALVLTRLERTNDQERDLRNDSIDGLHYALAATFCERIAVRERTMQRIRELLPEPRLPLLRVIAIKDRVDVALVA